NHPFWAPGAGEWIGAGRLVFGDDLATPDGGRAMVVGSHRYTAERRVHNLTVADLHTFYVTVGGRHLLVHNDPDKGVCDRLAGERAKISRDVDNALKNRRFDDADGLVDQAQRNADEARDLARRNPTQANKDAANRAQREVDALRKKVVDSKIDDAMRSGNPDTRLEATTANSIRNVVRDFGRKYGRKGDLGEIDIETNKAIIEISNGRNFTKADQLAKLMNDRRMNPNGKPVILFAAQLSGKQIAMARQTGAIVVRTEYELKEALRKLGEPV
uniref:polymorphic toxin-type HINT domain-containing protein n=1 Tax=Spirillospora albida TaxID=58123 RepID=UPI00056272E2